ncbi:hypothetical protein [Mycolicibacterium sp. CBMA 226]|uniref:hypothetical protein n=1 Tax=Mycolicibacterium sp. CBMA 226 TaxID=2606611 RepID=UPI0012DCCB0C|nr:hypothetical protein [Mycolicibacterium sp. CBMA 226]MUL78841.1 hypothetical protein [Mycolicibacterium sp. CBMA 226]QGW61138.1 hypothetical protein ICEMyc226_00106 [Mycolicibacterium sp.]
MSQNRPFDLGRFGMRPPSLTASEVLPCAMDTAARQDVWRCTGLLPALTMVAGLFADLDLAAINDSRSNVEHRFIAGHLGDAERVLVAGLRQGRTVFTHTGLVQCIKEIVLCADEGSDAELSAADLTRCVLGVNQEADERADPGLVVRAHNPELSDLETLRKDFLEMAVDHVAQELLDNIETFETLASGTHEMWREGWAPGIDPGVTRDLGSGAADVFADVVGVDLDDFLTLGWTMWNLARNDQLVGFGADLLAETGVGAGVLNAFAAQCALSLDELRQRLSDQDDGDAAGLLVRYILQEFPFLRLADGSLLMLRLQYAVQRVFGDLLWLKVYDGLKAVDSQRASRFKNAMNTNFEYRVGQVLTRIAEHERGRFPGVIVTEDEFKAAWRNSRGVHPKICDFAYTQRGAWLLFDANNRNVPKDIAERVGGGEDLRTEIRKMFVDTKFGQLTSTASELITRKWAADGALADSSTRFLPFVVAPNAGMPASEFTEFLILEQSAPLVSGFNNRVWPPGIIKMCDLQLLEGLAERRLGPGTFAILMAWRMENYQRMTRARGIPLPLSAFIDVRLPQLGRPMAQHQRTVGAAFFEALRINAIRHATSPR